MQAAEVASKTEPKLVLACLVKDQLNIWLARNCRTYSSKCEILPQLHLVMATSLLQDLWATQQIKL